MLIIKLMLMFSITILTTYIGFFKANTYAEREKEISKILTALNFMKNKIEYTNMLLKDIFLEISEDIFNNKENIFKSSIEANLNIRNAFKKAVEENLKLEREEKNVLCNFAMNLGLVDKQIQISEIKIAYEFLLEAREDAKIKMIKNSKMYKTLGVVSGLTISIILI